MIIRKLRPKNVYPNNYAVLMMDFRWIEITVDAKEPILEPVVINATFIDCPKNITETITLNPITETKLRGISNNPHYDLLSIRCDKYKEFNYERDII